MARPKARLRLAEVLTELEANGSAQTRRTYRNAGVEGDLFGTSYAFLKQFHKRAGVDHELALALWEQPALEARIFACWVADGDRATIRELGSWAREESPPPLAGELAAYVQDTRFAAGRMRRWMTMKSAYRRHLAWHIAAKLVMQPQRAPSEGGVEESEVGALLEKLEAGIQNEPDRVRYTMNNALIAIGCRPGWMRKALSVAGRVGKVEVDSGPRSCKVPGAVAQIRKTVDHYKLRGQSPTDGAGGQRRRHC